MPSTLFLFRLSVVVLCDSGISGGAAGGGVDARKAAEYSYVARRDVGPVGWIEAIEAGAMAASLTRKCRKCLPCTRTYFRITW